MYAADITNKLNIPRPTLFDESKILETVENEAIQRVLDKLP